LRRVYARAALIAPSLHRSVLPSLALLAHDLKQQRLQQRYLPLLSNPPLPLPLPILPPPSHLPSPLLPLLPPRVSSSPLPIQRILAHRADVVLLYSSPSLSNEQTPSLLAPLPKPLPSQVRLRSLLPRRPPLPLPLLPLPPPPPLHPRALLNPPPPQQA
jgi:hypothetical protein